MRSLSYVWGVIVGCGLAGTTCGLFAAGSVITTSSGMQLHGKAAKISSINQNPLNGEVVARPIVIVDDELRRTFFPFRKVISSVPAPATGHERIKIQQRVATAGRRIAVVGPIIEITPFDEYGRQTFSMLGPRGRLDVILGITEITPTYTRVQGLVATGLVWDLRIATTSIPRPTLTKILMKHLDATDPDARLKIVNLYIQSERLRDALNELEAVIQDFPDLKNLEERATGLRQLYAQHLLREISARRDAGQHERVSQYLNQFPTEGIAGETLLRVRNMLGEYDRQRKQYEQLMQQLKSDISQIKDADALEVLQEVFNEIELELNFNTLSRMADYLRLSDDDDLSVEEKLSLAVSGWLLGSGAGTENLAVALSLFETRNAIRIYLGSDRPDEHQAALAKIRAEEGGAPAYVAGLIANMLPPQATQVPELHGQPGYYQLEAPGIKQQPNFTYYLQLPPEYDPHRRYPCVVTLNGTGTNAEQQVNWWAGDYSAKAQMRQGQAARRGYIVVAPVWTKPLQQKYEYTAREHAAVLFSLRDACRRTSIDTDRVFLSGHSMGGTAAWDIGLAHPDIWAGVIPIVANAEDKYIAQYHENGRDLPMYFVGGEKDAGWLHDNGVEFDRYLTRAYDTTVVQYRGRGHENFQDEVQRLYDWMGLTAHRRVFFPREFDTVSMRPWDNFFWWLEVSGFKRETMVLPAEWVRGSKRPSKISCAIRGQQRISIRTASQAATVWLTPELVDFGQQIDIVVNGRKVREPIVPDVETLLEDVRTRGDRQHPFWAKVEVAGRRQGGN